MERGRSVDPRLGNARGVESTSTGRLGPSYHRSTAFTSQSVLVLALILAAILSATPIVMPARPVGLVFVGDVMLGRDVARALDGDWADAFADVRPLLVEADFAFANLESPLTRAPFAGGRFDLRAPPEAIGALTAAGFDVVSLANNHAFDGGWAGVAETLDTLRRAGVVALADPRTQDLGELALGDDLTVRIGNLRVSFFALFDTGRPLDTSLISEAAARADVVVISIHWGAEYSPTTQRQRALSRELVAAGADLIVGHGPHVLQAIENLDGALVAYSLGNFLFDQPFIDTRQGAILHITLDRGSITAVEAIPTVIRRGRVQLASGDEVAAILNQLRVPAEKRTRPAIDEHAD